jgi:hypothetical protein
VVEQRQPAGPGDLELTIAVVLSVVLGPEEVKGRDTEVERLLAVAD